MSVCGVDDALPSSGSMCSPGGGGQVMDQVQHSNRQSLLDKAAPLLRNSFGVIQAKVNVFSELKTSLTLGLFLVLLRLLLRAGAVVCLQQRLNQTHGISLENLRPGSFCFPETALHHRVQHLHLLTGHQLIPLPRLQFLLQFLFLQVTTVLQGHINQFRKAKKEKLIT